MLYSVTATITYKRKGQEVTGQIPPFILDARAHNIANMEQAWFIASEIINPTRNKKIQIAIRVMEVDRKVWAA